MSDTEHLLRVMKRIQWQQAKGRLKAVIEAADVHNPQTPILIDRIESFIREVEDHGLVE